MKKFLMLAMVVLGMAMGAPAQNRTVDFIKGKTLEELKARAKEEKKFIFLDFYTSWCTWCKVMDKKIYTNDTVADFYNFHFLAARIDAEKGEGIGLKKKFGIQAYPSFIFISPEGEMVHMGLGYKSPKDFIQLGADAMNPKKQISKTIDSLRSIKGDRMSILKLLNCMDSVGMATEKTVSDYLATQRDSNLFLAENWQIINHYVRDAYSHQLVFFVDNYEKYSMLYGDSVVNKKIMNIFIDKARMIAHSNSKDKEMQLDSLRSYITKNHFPKEDLILARSEMNYHSSLGNWKKFSEIAASGIIEKYYLVDRSMMPNLSTVLWNFYDHIDDPTLLARAVAWASRSIELEDDSVNNNIYAFLLLKAGKKEQALEAKSKSLRLAMKNGQIEEKDYEKLLRDFLKRN